MDFWCTIGMTISYVLFDLDNTLYHASSPILKRINVLINRYVMEYFNVSFDEANAMRRNAYGTYGTTLRWLQAEHSFEKLEGYLQFIHPEDAADWVTTEAGLREQLDSVPQPKSVLTNSISEHAERVLGVLGIRDQFEAVYDLRFNNIVCKPEKQAYVNVLGRLDVPTEEVLFIDDNPRFLAPFAELGGQAALMDHLDQHPDCEFARFRSIGELCGYIKNAAPILV